MGLSRNKVAVSEGAAGSPPFYGERVIRRNAVSRSLKIVRNNKTIDGDTFQVGKEIVVQFSRTNKFLNKKIVGVINAEGPPVPIPNTEVKLCSGDNTLRATVREDSSMPTLRKERKNVLPFLSRRGEKSKTLYGGVAQLGEHLPCKQGVMGSNPIISTK